VYNFINVNNPDYASEKKVKMIVPIVQKDGSKKTRFVNVVDICKRYVHDYTVERVKVLTDIVCIVRPNTLYSISSPSWEHLDPRMDNSI